VSRTEEVYAFLKERGGWVSRHEVDRFVRELREGRPMAPTSSPDRGAGIALNGLLRGGSVRYMEDQSHGFWRIREEVTASGRVLTDEDFEALADEAERGYDVDELLRRRTCEHCGLENPGPEHTANAPALCAEEPQTHRYEVTARFTVWARSEPEAREKVAGLGSRSRGIKRPGPDRVDGVTLIGRA
jgi:hypothetical protein